MADKKPIKTAIIGLGRSGWAIHKAALAQIPDKFTITAVVDADANRQKDAIEQLRCKAYGDYKEVLNDKEIELVVVTVPSFLHKQYVIDALNAGKACICEKPMALDSKEADEMIAVSKKNKMFLTIFQNLRYNPAYFKVREVINSGKLGRIVLIRSGIHSFGRRWDWQTLKEFGGGLLNNYGSHKLDQILQIFGEAEPEIFCDLQRTLTLGDAEDHVKLILKAKGAPIVDIELSSAAAYPQEEWLVMGTQGGLTGNSNKLKWKYFDPKELAPRVVDKKSTPDRSYNREVLPWKEETWDAGDQNTGNLNFYADVYNSIRNGAPVAITPESVRRQIAILEKCRKMCSV